jgi:hypothetical protein
MSKLVGAFSSAFPQLYVLEREVPPAAVLEQGGGVVQQPGAVEGEAPAPTVAASQCESRVDVLEQQVCP